MLDERDKSDRNRTRSEEDIRVLRVLVVDDTESIRMMLGRLLGSDTTEVVGTAKNGEEAVALVAELRPDLVIMDYNMPVRDGVSATEEIKKRWPDVEVLGYSSTPFEEETRKMLEAGASESFDKLHVDELVDAVRKRVRRSAISRTKLLIVDDNDDVRWMLRMRLEMTNLDIVGEALDGADAIKKTEELQPHVIVMDLKMPEVDGIEATRQIKARWPDIKVVGYTSFPTKELTDAGAVASFAKTDPEELIRAVLEFE